MEYRIILFNIATTPKSVVEVHAFSSKQALRVDGSFTKGFTSALKDAYFASFARDDVQVHIELVS